MIPVRSFEHFGLMSPDTEVLKDWYCGTLGAKILSQSQERGGIFFLQFPSGGLIEIIPLGPDQNHQPLGPAHLAFGVDDLDETLIEIEKQGIPVTRPIFTAYEGSRTFFVMDPQGNTVQFVQRDKKSALFGR